MKISFRHIYGEPTDSEVDILITIQGAQAVGKTTLARWLAGQLAGDGHSIVVLDGGGPAMPERDYMASSSDLEIDRRRIAVVVANE
jgi:adenylylsulfate kinase-like enzyme